MFGSDEGDDDDDDGGGAGINGSYPFTSQTTYHFSNHLLLLKPFITSQTIYIGGSCVQRDSAVVHNHGSRASDEQATTILKRGAHKVK